MNTLKTIDEAILLLEITEKAICITDSNYHAKVKQALTNLKALRDKLGSDELVEGMEAQDILNRCTNLNDYIYREDPEYYGDYYVTLFKELHRLKAVIKAMGV
jgi:hypothetical protein